MTHPALKHAEELEKAIGKMKRHGDLPVHSYTAQRAMIETAKQAAEYLRRVAKREDGAQ